MSSEKGTEMFTKRRLTFDESSPVIEPEDYQEELVLGYEEKEKEKEVKFEEKSPSLLEEKEKEGKGKEKGDFVLKRASFVQKRESLIDNITEETFSEIQKTSAFRLRNASYPTRISCAMMFIFSIFVAVFFAPGYPLATVACITLILLSLLGMYCSFSYHESLLLTYVAVFAIWIVVWFLTAVLSISLSGDDSGIGAIASARCQFSSVQKIYPSNCSVQVKQRLLITSLIICGILTLILSIAWKISLSFYLFVISEEEDDDDEIESSSQKEFLQAEEEEKKDERLF